MRNDVPVLPSLVIKSVKRSTCPDVSNTLLGVRLVHSISNIVSSSIKCCRHSAKTFAFNAHAGGPYCIHIQTQ